MNQLLYTDILLQSGDGSSGGALLLGGIVMVVLFVLFLGGSSSSQSIQRDELSNLDDWDSTEDIPFPKENIKRLTAAIEDREEKLRRIVKNNAIQYDNPETGKRVAQIDVDPNYRVELRVRTSENKMATINDKKIQKNTDESDVEYNVKLINARIDILPEIEQEE